MPSKHTQFLPTRKLVKKIKIKITKRENKRGREQETKTREDAHEKSKTPGMHSTTGARVPFGKCEHLPHLHHSREKKDEAGRKEGIFSRATPANHWHARASTTRPAPNAKPVTISCIVSAY